MKLHDEVVRESRGDVLEKIHQEILAGLLLQNLVGLLRPSLFVRRNSIYVNVLKSEQRHLRW